ncbi:MAG: hypothetical protein GF307_14970 [candidate division Zixibacteria bacterium]|nr:hypothetical protein [candidate division Zixibacteria bacterium]
MMNRDITRTDLNFNFLTHISGLVRDIHASIMKTQIYPPGHRMVGKFMEKPLAELEKIFKIKQKLTIELQSNSISSEGLLLPANKYTNEFGQAMIRNRINNIVFDSDVWKEDFHLTFVYFYGNKAIAGDFKAMLEQADIESIKINVANPLRLFPFEQSGYFENDPRLIARNQIAEILRKEPCIAVAAKIGWPLEDDEVITHYGFDLRRKALAIVGEDLLKEMQLDKILESFRKFASERKDILAQPPEEIIIGMKKFFDFIGTVHGRSSSALEFRNAFRDCGFSDENIGNFFDNLSAVRLQASDNAGTMSKMLETGNIDTNYEEEFNETIDKLVGGNLWDGVEELANSLFNNLNSHDNDIVEKSLLLSKELINRVLKNSFNEIYVKFLKTFEEWGKRLSHSEPMARLNAFTVKQLLENKKYQDALPLASLFGEMGFERKISDAIKSTIIDSRLSQQVAEDFIKPNKSNRKFLFELGLDLGSPALVEKLLPYIADNDKDLRSSILRIITASGENAFPVIEKFIQDTIGFVRENDGKTLQNQEWFTLRNIITVIKNIGSEQGIPLLEKMKDDPDNRIRMEIIRSLENIKAEKSLDLLTEFANDKDEHIRDTAIITIGLMGLKESFEILRGILEKNPHLHQQALTAMGYLKRPESEEYLILLYKEPELLKNFGYSKEEIESVGSAAETVLKKTANKEFKKLNKNTRKRSLPFFKK